MQVERMEPERLRAVIVSAQAGDSSAYRELLDTYGRRLYGYFLRATGSHHDAEDLLGEVMLRLVARLDKYDDRGRFEPWLFRIAANMVRDRIRRAKANPAPASLSIDSEAGASRADQLLANTGQVDERLLAEEASGRLRRALTKLDDTTRDMILVRHFGQMNYKEIADLFQCPLGTALARVHRGLKALRRMMGRNYESD
jgi:RNA polymerase sigma factor (sigma-70 family)